MCGSECRKQRKLTDAERQMVVDNKGLVYTVVYREANAGRIAEWEVEDAIQEGMLALIRVATYYDANTGYSFSTLAVPRIQQQLWNWQQKKRRLKRSATLLSIDVTPMHDRPYAELMPSDDDTEQETLTDLVDQVVDGLEKRGKSRVARMLWLYAKEGMTLEETANELGISRQAVNQQFQRNRQIVEEIIRGG